MSNSQELISPYTWLGVAPTPIPKEHLNLEGGAALLSYLSTLPEGSLLHFDFETNGLKYWARDFRIVGLGLWHVGEEYPAYLRLDTIVGDKTKALWLVQLLSQYRLSAYNLVFDGGCFFALNRTLGKKSLPDSEILDCLTACPLTLFRMLANEGKQSHSLETAQKNFFGWDDSQKGWLKELLASNNLSKGEMWKLQDIDPNGFAYYCAVDSYACGKVWQHLVSECQRINNLGPVKFHMREGVAQIRELIEAAYTGIRVNVDKLRVFMLAQFKETARLEEQLRTHPMIAHHIAGWEKRAWDETFVVRITERKKVYKDSEIVKALLTKAKADTSLLPDILEIEEEIEESYKGRTQATPIHIDGDNLINRSYSLLLEGSNKKPPRFNLASSAQREWLFYTAMGSAERIIDEFERDVYKYTMNDGRIVYLPPTKKGNKPTGKEIFPVLGELGDVFKKYKKAQKLVEYAVSYYAAALEHKDGKSHGIIHPTFSPNGTHTGRLSANGGINAAQLPKVEAFLECFEAFPGKIFYDFDFTALEKVVQAEFSKCPALRSLYASGKTHDVHLFNTKSIHPDPEIRSQIEQAYTPDKEVLDKLAKQFKAARTLGKGVGFSLDYGAGKYKIFRSLTNQGFPVTYSDVEQMVDAYKTLYKAVYKFGYDLQREWDNNGGVIENGLGFPISIPERYKHDTNSRFVQNTGHYMLMIANYYIWKMRQENNIERPVIPDLHDERIGEGLPEDAERIMAMYQKGVDMLNEQLQPEIPFTISFASGPTLWHIKK